MTVTFHLTHTGPYAGMTICGATEHTPNDQHPSYNRTGLQRQLANCCRDCREAWLEDLYDCAECGHLHWTGSEYVTCPISGCDCEGQA